MTRDRRGRARRTDHDRRRRPLDGFRVRDDRRFAALVDRALGHLPEELAGPVRGVPLRVRPVPPATAGAGAPPLARFDQRDGVVVYRRSVEARATSRDELEDVVAFAIGTAVARTLGLEHLLDGWWDDEDW